MMDKLEAAGTSLETADILERETTKLQKLIEQKARSQEEIRRKIASYNTMLAGIESRQREVEEDVVRAGRIANERGLTGDEEVRLTDVSLLPNGPIATENEEKRKRKVCFLVKSGLHSM